MANWHVFFGGQVQSEREEIKQHKGMERKGKEGWMDGIPPVPFKPTIFTASPSLLSYGGPFLYPKLSYEEKALSLHFHQKVGV